jgi:hypothetical protein
MMARDELTGCWQRLQGFGVYFGFTGVCPVSADLQLREDFMVQFAALNTHFGFGVVASLLATVATFSV